MISFIIDYQLQLTVIIIIAKITGEEFNIFTYMYF